MSHNTPYVSSTNTLDETSFEVDEKEGTGALSDVTKNASRYSDIFTEQFASDLGLTNCQTTKNDGKGCVVGCTCNTAKGWYPTAADTGSTKYVKVKSKVRSYNYDASGTKLASAAPATCYHKAECNYEYFIPADLKLVNCGSSCSDGACCQNGCMNALIEGGYQSIWRSSSYTGGIKFGYCSGDKYYTGYKFYNKISNTSESCSKDGKTYYQTICSGTPKGECGTKQKFVSNGCTSSTSALQYYGKGYYYIVGAEFGDCVCDSSQGYYSTESECKTHISASDDAVCKYAGGCYSISPCDNSRGYYSTMEKCNANKPEPTDYYTCERDSTTSCYKARNTYFTIQADLDFDDRCHDDSYSIMLGDKGTQIRDGYSGTYKEGTYKLYVSLGYNSKDGYGNFRLYRNNVSLLIGCYTNNGNALNTDSSCTTSGVEYCGGGTYNCLAKSFTFEGGLTYIVRLGNLACNIYKY